MSEKSGDIQRLTGQDLTGQNLTGQNLTGQNLTGQNLTRQDLTGIFPLEFANVTLELNNVRLIKEVSCRLEKNTQTIIIGPNGAGKSLFLRLAHGLLKPTSGEIRWLGRAKHHSKERQAMVLQRPVMLRRSVQANIDYALSLHKIPKRERASRIRDVLAQTGLSRFARHPARILSGGEQQRLAIARAWSIRPEVLFLDEPTASLDPAATYQVEETIRAIHQSGTKIIMATHDLGQAQRLADEVIFLHRGRIKEHAFAETFFQKPENDLAQAFIKGELLWWRRRQREPETHTE